MSVTVRDLDGITIARLIESNNGPTLTLAAPSGFLDGNYYPAESITIQGEAVDVLFELLRDARKPPEARPPQPPLPKLTAGDSSKRYTL